MNVGSLAEWVSGIGALAAAVVALRVAGDGRRVARDDRRAAVRDRVAGRMVDLIRAVEADIALSSPAVGIHRSPEAAGLCRALWGYRNWFGTTWHVYCESDQGWPMTLLADGQLFDRMRVELQEALNKLDFEDAAPDAPRPGWRDRLPGRRKSLHQRLP